MAVFPIEQIPLTIPGCILWFDTIDTSSTNMTYDGSGRVSWIKNKANNSTGGVTQSTASAQPQSGVQTINGLNAINFDNDNERFLNTNIGSSLTNCTIFSVVQQVVSGAQGYIIAGTGANQTIRIRNNNVGFSHNDGTSSFNNDSGSSILTNPAIIALACDVSGATRYSYKNTITSQASGSYDGAVGSQYFGTISNVAGNARGGYKQGEMIIYNRLLSSAEITKIVNYLSDRWGIALI